MHDRRRDSCRHLLLYSVETSTRWLCSPVRRLALSRRLSPWRPKLADEATRLIEQRLSAIASGQGIIFLPTVSNHRVVLDYCVGKYKALLAQCCMRNSARSYNRPALPFVLIEIIWFSRDARRILLPHNRWLCSITSARDGQGPTIQVRLRGTFRD